MDGWIKRLHSKFNYIPFLTTNAAQIYKQTKRRPFQSRETSLFQLCVPSRPFLLPIAAAVNARSSPGGCHAVSILYPWASPQQWPTWESRPGGGINQLPPSLSGLLPVHNAAAPGPEPSWFPSPWEPAGIPREENSDASRACGDIIFHFQIWHGGLLGQCCQRRSLTVLEHKWKLDFWVTFIKMWHFCGHILHAETQMQTSDNSFSISPHFWH